MEPTARAIYSTLMAVQVQETGFWVHPQHAHIGASPDGLVGGDGLLEIKCPVYRPHDSVPPEYMCQIQGQLACCPGRQWCDFLSWHEGSNQALIVRVPRSDAFWHRYLEPRLQRFWHALQTDQPPAPAPGDNAPPPDVAVQVLYSGSVDLAGADDDEDW
eukprot:g2736.t1